MFILYFCQKGNFKQKQLFNEIIILNFDEVYNL